MALNNHIIRRVLVMNEDLCQLNCYLEPNCVSYNYGPSGYGAFVCELSECSHQGVYSSDLTTRAGFTYNTITVSGVCKWAVNPNHFPRFFSSIPLCAAFVLCCSNSIQNRRGAKQRFDPASNSGAAVLLGSIIAFNSYCSDLQFL